jgi:hypothetical protein
MAPLQSIWECEFFFRNSKLGRPFWIDNNICDGMTAESPADVKFEIDWDRVHQLFWTLHALFKSRASR